MRCPICGNIDTRDPVSFKRVKTIKDYPVKYNGYSFTIPKGSIITNHTACGNDDSYRFWQDWSQYTKEITGYKPNTLDHDLTYHGLNIPPEYCEPYEEA